MAYGQTVAATINGKPAQVTRPNDNWLKVEPDQLYRVISAISEDGRALIQAERRKLIPGPNVGHAHR